MQYLIRISQREMAVTLISGIVFLCGCSSQSKPISDLKIDSEKASSEAMELYDTNKDASISAEEAEKFVSLNARFAQFDKDKNGSVSKEELKERIQSWVDDPAKLVTGGVSVSMDGQILQGAEVKFIPEPFLKGAIPEAVCTTGIDGVGHLKLTGEDVPEKERGLQFVRLGMYRVEITHPQQKIPAKYNTETTLGWEVISNTDANVIPFKLKSS